MPRSRRRLRARVGELSVDQYDELAFGPHYDHLELVSDFADDEAREDAWFANREEILAEEPAGSRPWAWWQYESGLKDSFEKPRPSGHEAEVWLRKQRLLTPFEERELDTRDRMIRDQAGNTLSPESEARYRASAALPTVKTSNAADLNPGGAS